MSQENINKLPYFKKNEKNSKIWLQNEERTAKFITYFWNLASKQEKLDPSFLFLLIQFGWCNVNSNGSTKTTKKWRNTKLADYLKIFEYSPASLIESALGHWPKADLNELSDLFNSDTGITHYYKAYRPNVFEFVKKNKLKIAQIFNIVGSKNLKSLDKIEKAMKIIDDLPLVNTPKGDKTSILNAISPSLACVDSNKRFPIMNQKTAKLLATIGADHNKEGAKKLFRLIGTYIKVENNLELDIYSQYTDFPAYKKGLNPRFLNMEKRNREVGFKSEELSYAEISKKKTCIHKEHNQLTNKFKEAVLGVYNLRESDFDILITNWKKEKMLLIEAKTSSTGVSGRSQVRQAIGQLFDYRKNSLKNDPEEIDMAVLLPNEPALDIIDLLKSINIEVLWFKNDKLKGTIQILNTL